jgi:hypothetical protein
MTVCDERFHATSENEEALSAMGERGHTVHIVDAVIGDLASSGHRIAVLGNTERWTTFVPTEASTFDGGRASRIAGRPLVHVWFDEDVGVSVQVYSSGYLVGELSLPGEDAEVTESDCAFTATLEDDAATSSTLNAWFAQHEEARAHLAERRASGHAVFLLAYKRQFLVVDDHFIEALGLDPADPDWMAIGYDWVRPAERAARQRLYSRRLDVVARRA